MHGFQSWSNWRPQNESFLWWKGPKNNYHNHQEKQIQEEVAEEFEAMQKEAIEAREVAASLTTEVSLLQGKLKTILEWW